MAARRYPPNRYYDAVVKHDGDRRAAAAELGTGLRAVWENLRICEQQGLKAPAPLYHRDRLAYVRGPQALGPNPAALQAEIDDLRGQLEAVTTVKRWAARKRKDRTARKPRIGTKHLVIPD